MPTFSSILGLPLDGGTAFGGPVASQLPCPKTGRQQAESRKQKAKSKYVGCTLAAFMRLTRRANRPALLGLVCKRPTPSARFSALTPIGFSPPYAAKAEADFRRPLKT